MFELMRAFSAVNNGRPVDPAVKVWADLALPTLGWAVAPAPADVVETQDAILVRLDLPGHKNEEIHLKVENDVLSIEAQRKVDEKRGETYHRAERVFGKVSRSFTLPANVDSARTEARYVDGVLEISLPKREEAKPRTIEIKATR